MRRLRRVNRSLLLAAAVLVVAVAAASECSSQPTSNRHATATPQEATRGPEVNEDRTEAHSAPHIDLPAGVLVFRDWSGVVYSVRPDGAGLSNVGLADWRTARPVIVQGGSRVNFEPATPAAFAPATKLSPDGWRLATFDQDGVHVANADGSASRRVSGEIAQSPGSSRIAWSSDNRHVFVSDGQGRASGAWIDVDGGGTQLLPEAVVVMAISPSGDRIAYGSQPSGLRVARADGSDPVYVNGGLEVSPYDLWSVAWSPNGDRLAFPVAGADKGFAIAAADGSGAVLIPGDLVAPLDRVASLAWSPDGRYVALSGSQDPVDHRRILVFDTRDTQHPPIALDAGLTGLSEVQIVWWDDGLGFYFVGRGEYVGEGVGHQGVYSVSLDGKTDILLSGATDVASIVGVTH